MDTEFFRRPEVGPALKAATRAAFLCRQVQAEMVNPSSAQKRDRSPVTVADYGAQAVVCQSLTSNFPEIPIVAEESSEALRQDDQNQMLRQVTGFVQTVLPGATQENVCDWIDMGSADATGQFWTLDPIDGTAGFLRREQYAVALALIDNGQVELGVLICPNLPMDLSDPDSEQGTVFLAQKGQGAVTFPLGGGKPQVVSVAPLTELSQARVVESVESGHANHGAHQGLATNLGIVQPSLRIDSQAKYGVVARGDAAIYLRLPSTKTPDYRERIWDHAAGVLLVEEAGGRVTDAYGAPLDFNQGRKLLNNKGVVVSNGYVHTALLEALGGMGYS